MRITFLQTKTKIMQAAGCRSGRFFLALFLIIISIFFIAGLNRGALAPQITGMDTADGCATIYVRDLFSETSFYDGYKKVNEEDISTGRFRPFGHYYLAASYFINALRCGVPFVLGCQIPMQKLINAELRGHTQFQIVFAGLVVGLASCLVLFQSGSWLAAFCVVLFGSSSLSLGGNLYKYYADGQEILLALSAILYLYCFLKGLSAIERGKSWTWSYVIGCFFAVLMTASKETVIAIAGVFIVFCVYDLGLRWWRNRERHGFNRRDRYLAAHIALLVGTQAWLLISIPPAPGRYTERYSLRSVSELWDRLQKIALMLADNPGAGMYMAVVAALFVVSWILLWVRPSHMDNQARNSLRLALLSGGVGISSVLIYLPWEFVIRKYLYCAEVFIIVCTCSLIGALMASLRLMGLNRILMVVIGAGLMVVPLRNIRTTLLFNDRFFAERYQSRHLLATACRELQADVSLHHQGEELARVAVFDSLPALGHAEITGQEQLHLERFLNKACGINILSNGQFHFTRRSDYSNLVLAPYPYAPLVEISLLEKWRDSDWTYVLLIDSGRKTAIDFGNIRQFLESNPLYSVVARKSFKLPKTEKRAGEIVMYRRRTTNGNVL